MNKQYRSRTVVMFLLLITVSGAATWGSVQAAPSASDRAPSLAAPALAHAVAGDKNKTGLPASKELDGNQPAVSGIAYSVTPGSGTIISATNDSGNHCDDCTTAITPTFPITFYGATYASFNASSNGNIQFNSNLGTAIHWQGDDCLPTGSQYSGLHDVLEVYWSDLDTSQNNGSGIYTATLGSTPHRQFVVEWRTTYYERPGTSDEEVIFYEDSPTITVIYGTNVDRGDHEAAGIEEGTGLGGNSYTLYSCDQPRTSNGLRLDYVPYNLQTTTPTPVASATATPPAACGDLSGWSYTSALASETEYPAVASDGSSLYAVGGVYSSSNYLDQLAIYNPISDTWSYGPSAPISLAAASAVYAPGNNKVYVFGGYNNNGAISSTLIYDIAAHSWSSGAPLPDIRTAMAAGYDNGKIYLVGGNNYGSIGSGTPYSQTWEYDVAANTWLTRTGMPDTSFGAASGVINGHLYLAGGDDGSYYLNTMYDYNIASDTWTQRANLPTTLRFAAGATLSGQFYSIGGGGLNEMAEQSVQPLTTNETFVYDPSSDTWADGPTLNQPRSHLGAASVGSSLVAVGGYNYRLDASLSSVETSAIRACTPTPVVTSTPTPAATTTQCPIPFVDIAGNVFRGAIEYLYCRHVVNGTDSTHYSPAGTSTRGQFAKVVVLGFGTPFYTPAIPDFSDVPPTYFAYLYIESGFHGGILSGFDANTCQQNGQPFPCYLPNRPITRGQLTKLVVNAAQYALYTPSGGVQDFTDVPTTNVFFASIETAYHQGVVGGYADHTYRPNNPIRRDEMAQIVFKGVTTP